jgi:hypothetical protein
MPAAFNKTPHPKMIKLIFDEHHYFGHCPILTHENYYLNISRGHWMVCDECKIRWFIGANLFSSWRNQTKTTWKKNFIKIKDYEKINT